MSLLCLGKFNRIAKLANNCSPSVNALNTATVFAMSSFEFREYQYSINDLEPYTGFVIKIVFNGTNQAEVPVLKNIRALALA